MLRLKEALPRVNGGAHEKPRPRSVKDYGEWLTGGGEKGTKETRDNHSLEVLGDGCRKGETDGDEHGREDGQATPVDFGQGRPQQGPEAEAHKEERRAENGNLRPDAEFFGHLGRAGRV